MENTPQLKKTQFQKSLQYEWTNFSSEGNNLFVCSTKTIFSSRGFNYDYDEDGFNNDSINNGDKQSPMGTEPMTTLPVIYILWRF